MQAGSLKHQIELQRRTETMGAGRRVVETWETYARGRAALRQSGTSEFLAGPGETEVNNAVFLIRFVPGVSVADRILHDGRVWNVVAIAEIGRRKGLELRAVAA